MKHSKVKNRNLFRYNKSLIFKNAWILKKRHGYSLSQSLKISWKYEKEKVKNFKFEQVLKTMKSSLDYFSYYVAKKANINKDDAYQKLTMKIFKCFNKFDPDRSTVKTFYSRVLNNYAIDIIKSERLKKADYENAEMNSLVDWRDYHSEFEVKALFGEAAKNLDIKSKSILEKIVTGLSITEIAKDFDCTNESIFNIIRRKIKPELAKVFC